jgi:NADPH-dependent 2,4-dienoyl-CoA reductase/sulfur reductase-like enzyme
VTSVGLDRDTRSPAGLTSPAGADGLSARTAGYPAGVTDETVDAVVVGAGPNGLVAACLLADAGWDVCLLEANDRVGGAVASVERAPGYVSDL